MFVILSYDIEVKRNQKVMKTVKQYLRPVQKSVFEGYISDRNLNRLKKEIAEIIEPEKDSVVIYCIEWGRPVTKEFIGKICQNNSQIL